MSGLWENVGPRYCAFLKTLSRFSVCDPLPCQSTWEGFLNRILFGCVLAKSGENTFSDEVKEE